MFERLENYQKACKQLFADGIQLHGDGSFSRLDSWYVGLELGVSSVRSESQVRESVAFGFEHPAFAGLKDQERLQKMKEDFCNAEHGTFDQNLRGQKSSRRSVPAYPSR